MTWFTPAAINTTLQCSLLVTPILQRLSLQLHQLAVKCKVKMLTARNTLRLEIYFETKNYLEISYKTKFTKTKMQET
jgi:hypothetical protein